MLCGEPGGQLAAGRGRGLAGEDQVAERAEAEDVEQRGRLRGRELRGQVGAGRALDVRQQRGGAAADGCEVVALVRAVPPWCRAGGRRPASRRSAASGSGRPAPRRPSGARARGGKGGGGARGRAPRRAGGSSPAGCPAAGPGVPADEVVEALPVRAVPEDDRRAGQELVAVLLGADDAVVRDALQRQVLAVRGALDGLAVLVGRGALGEEDADPAGLVGRAATGWWRGSPPRSGRRRRTSRSSS